MIRTISTLLCIVLTMTSFAHNLAIDSTEESEIKFKNFEAIASSKIVHFQWEVEQEAFGDRFIIEKSIDKINWKAIKEVESLGKHDETHTYQVSEINFAEGINEYFRILRVDSNGKEVEMDRVELSQPILSNMMVLPPLKKNRQNLIVSYDSMISSNGALFVKNLEGEIVYQKSMNFDEGYNRIELNLKKFTKGNYVVVLRDEYGNKITRSFNVYKSSRSKF